VQKKRDQGIGLNGSVKTESLPCSSDPVDLFQNKEWRKVSDQAAGKLAYDEAYALAADKAKAVAEEAKAAVKAQVEAEAAAAAEV